MAQLTPDRVLEVSTTIGTGSYQLQGAITGYRAASEVAVNNDTAYYYAEDVGMNGVPIGGWETGLGTWKTGGILERTTIHASSNSNNAVNWGSGTRRIGLSVNSSAFASLATQATTASTKATAAAASAATASAAASSAAASSASASASAGAALWVSGTSYTVGDLVWSPVTGRNYRRKIAGAGTTDPSADSTNWAATTLEIDTGLPETKPALLLDFSNSKKVDSLINFSRASAATYVDANGVIKSAATSVPRIDHGPVTGRCKGLLLEEASTNLLLRSEEFENAAWIASFPATVTANNTTAPDGTVTADLIDDTSAVNALLVRQNVTVADDSSSYTFSIFVKKNTSRYVALWLSFTGGTTRERVWTYDLDTLTSQVDDTLPATSGSIVDFGNGWRKITITASNTSELNTLIGCRLYPAIVGLGSVSGTATGSVWAWGGQLENRAYATSYIPTTTVQVTRAKDVATIDSTYFTDFYNQSEGTIFLRAEIPYFLASGAVGAILNIHDGTADNLLKVRFLSPGIDLYTVTSGTIVADTGQFAVNLNTVFEVAVAYNINDFAISVNGGAVLTDTSGNVPVVTKLELLQSISGSAWISGVSYYTRRLTDAKLITLSTL